MEKHFRTVDEDAVVLSADRVPVPVLVFLKGDPIKLPAKLSAADDVAKTFETSTQTLYATDPARKNAYPIIPTIPPESDVRHVHHALRKEAFPANEFGTTYLIVQQEQGHDDRVCASGVILGEGARQMTQAQAEKEAQRVAEKSGKVRVWRDRCSREQVLIRFFLSAGRSRRQPPHLGSRPDDQAANLLYSHEQSCQILQGHGAKL